MSQSTTHPPTYPKPAQPLTISLEDMTRLSTAAGKAFEYVSTQARILANEYVDGLPKHMLDAQALRYQHAVEALERAKAAFEAAYEAYTQH